MCSDGSVKPCLRYVTVMCCDDFIALAQMLGKATEDGNGRAGGETSGEAASLTASVRLALAGSKTWQRLVDGYRSAHQGKSFSGLPMNVFPGVCPAASATLSYLPHRTNALARRECSTTKGLNCMSHT